MILKQKMLGGNLIGYLRNGDFTHSIAFFLRCRKISTPLTLIKVALFLDEYSASRNPFEI